MQKTSNQLYDPERELSYLQQRLTASVFTPDKRYSSRDDVKARIAVLEDLKVPLEEKLEVLKDKAALDYFRNRKALKQGPKLQRGTISHVEPHVHA